MTGQRKWGFGPLGVVNCGKVIRQCIMDKGCLVGFIMQTQVISGDFLFLVWEIFTNGNLCHIYKGKCMAGFESESRRAESSSCVLFSQLPSAQTHLYARVGYSGVAYAGLLQS